MATYSSGGFPYIGVRVERGDTADWPPTTWVRIKEVFELSTFPRSWDQVEFTSHESGDPSMSYDLTRTYKPGLMGQGILTFRGIFLPTEHDWFNTTFISRTLWPYRLTYTFTSELNPDIYSGLAWIAAYNLDGDLGDKFTYEITLVFDGVLQPGSGPALSVSGKGAVVPKKEVQNRPVK